MNYVTTIEMSEIWGISARRIALLCEQERIEGEFLDEGMREDVWTLYRGDKPILSLIPEVYPSEIMGFMNAHVLYCGDVGAEEVDFALKRKKLEYTERLKDSYKVIQKLWR